MIEERSARALHYDASRDVLVVSFDAGGAGTAEHETRGTLLLDDDGHLAGLDLRDAIGVVVMLAPHERVARTAHAVVEVAAGEARIANAAATVRARERNPYLR